MVLTETVEEKKYSQHSWAASSSPHNQLKALTKIGGGDMWGLLWKENTNICRPPTREEGRVKWPIVPTKARLKQIAAKSTLGQTNEAVRQVQYGLAYQQAKYPTADLKR